MAEVSKKTAQRLTKAALMEVRNTLDEANCDPLKELAKLAMDPTTDFSTRVSILKDLNQYVHPKRRSIDIGNTDGNALVVNIRSFAGEAAKEMVDKEAMQKMIDDDYKED